MKTILILLALFSSCPVFAMGSARQASGEPLKTSRVEVGQFFGKTGKLTYMKRNDVESTVFSDSIRCRVLQGDEGTKLQVEFGDSKEMYSFEQTFETIFAPNMDTWMNFPDARSMHGEYFAIYQKSTPSERAYETNHMVPWLDTYLCGLGEITMGTPMPNWRFTRLEIRGNSIKLHTEYYCGLKDMHTINPLFVNDRAITCIFE